MQVCVIRPLHCNGYRTTLASLGETLPKSLLLAKAPEVRFHVLGIAPYIMTENTSRRVRDAADHGLRR